VIKSLNDDVPTNYWGNETVIEMSATLSNVNYKEIKVHHAHDGKYLEFNHGKKLLVISTPGHSRCSTSFLLEPEGVLFVSDTLGEMISTDVWLPLVFDDADQYEQSIKLLKDIDSNYLALGHHGMLIDNLAKTRAKALNSYYTFREFYAQGIANGMHTEQMVKELCRDYGQKSRSFVPHTLLVASMQRMLELFEKCEQREQAYVS
jgi:glyoxylase-like metal-dependent hydrolase (beta-lactamase superfamily II)